MTKIAILRDKIGGFPFEGDKYEVNLSREFGGYEPGDLICHINPFFNIPLNLEIAIRQNGDLIFRSWNWDMNGEWNIYLHTDEKGQAEWEAENRGKENAINISKPFIPTEEQIDTVNGLFSGRIKFEGLKLPVGATVQKICPIDVKREEMLLNKKIYLR